MLSRCCCCCAQVMSVGPKFKGIKMLPPGTHFLSFTVPGRQGGFSACSGFFLHLALKQVLVKRYNPAEEALEDLPEDEVSCRMSGCGIAWLPSPWLAEGLLASPLASQHSAARAGRCLWLPACVHVRAWLYRTAGRALRAGRAAVRL